jgi:hypothetical protein
MVRGEIMEGIPGSERRWFGHNEVGYLDTNNLM